jgi:hypothetical protein
MDECQWVRKQSARRFLNEAIRLAADSEAERLLVWCECGRPQCSNVLDVGAREYEAARSDGRHFLVAPGHGVGDVDVLLVYCTRFDLVKVKDDLAGVADALAPFSR